MTAHGFTEQEAYRRMQLYSMNKRLSIKEVAEAIIKAAEGHK
jgi:AmiR/NasT family two-component response regulator